MTFGHQSREEVAMKIGRSGPQLRDLSSREIDSVVGGAWGNPYHVYGEWDCHAFLWWCSRTDTYYADEIRVGSNAHGPTIEVIREDVVVWTGVQWQLHKESHGDY